MIVHGFILVTLLAGASQSLAAGSSEHRQEKFITATTEVGTSVYPLPTAGFGVVFFLTPHARIEANYTKGEIDFLMNCHQNCMQCD